MPRDTDRLFDVYITAQEAYPALEREFLSARESIEAGFRIFDPWTRLRSDDACQIGDTWFDLIVATLNRGVRITLIITDFDPVVRTSDHRYTWDCLRGLVAAGQAATRPDLLDVSISMHPARAGLLPRLLLWPRLLKEIAKTLSDVNDGPLDDRKAFWETTPGLRPYVKWRGDRLVKRKRPPAAALVTHHQKLAVFDDARLYIGGLDLNDRRYDTPEHERAADATWHDVQVCVDGPAAPEAALHLRTFRASIAGQTPVAAPNLLRTLSSKRRTEWVHLSPKSVLTEIAEAHRDRISTAMSLIYFETQFFRDRQLADALATRANERPDLNLILILPAAPEDAAFTDDPGQDVAFGEHLQSECIDLTRDGFGDRVFIGSPAQRHATKTTGRDVLHGAPIIYLHAKVSVFDRCHAIVASANLNGRSLAWDTEVGIATQSKHEAETLFQRCVRNWQGEDAPDAFFDERLACAAWAKRAHENAACPPEDRAGFILPYAAGPAEALASDLPGVPDEMV